jgi:hypothetical protein
MSRNLPANTEHGSVVPLRYRAPSPTVEGSSRRLVSSPLGDAVLAALPAVLRAVGRAAESADGARGRREEPPTWGSGYTVSQVEIDLAGPVVRRVVVRTASAWSTAPASRERPESRRRGRLVAGALGLGGLIVGLAAVRRAPGRSRPTGRVTPW